MSASMPVGLPACDGAGAPDRRAANSDAEPGVGAFEHTLREQMPRSARDGAPAGASRTAMAAPAGSPLEAAPHSLEALEQAALAEHALPALHDALPGESMSESLGGISPPIPAALAIDAMLLNTEGSEHAESDGQPQRARAHAAAASRYAKPGAAMLDAGQALHTQAAQLDAPARGAGMPLDPFSDAMAVDAATSVGESARQGATLVQSPPLSPLSSPPLAAPSAVLARHALAPAPALPPALPVLGDAQWGAALGARLVWSVTHGTHSASIALNPPELGPVNVNLVLNEVEARVSFQSQQLAVRDAIEAALPRLRELFADGGLTLREVDIGAGDARSDARREPAREGDQHARAHDRPESGSSEPSPVRLSDGLVDTFA